MILSIAEQIIKSGLVNYNQCLNHPCETYATTPCYDEGYMRGFNDDSFIVYDIEGGNGRAYHND